MTNTILTNLALASALLLGSAGITPALAEQQRTTGKSVQVEDAIEKLMSVINGAKKPLPAWALDTAMKAYKTYKTYKNGEKVEEVQQAVLAVLKTVAEIKTDVDAGRELSDKEYRRTRDLLDTQGLRLGDLEVRVDRVEKATRETAARLRAWQQRTEAAEARAASVERRFGRRGCPVGHAYRNGSCVDVAATPR